MPPIGAMVLRYSNPLTVTTTGRRLPAPKDSTTSGGTSIPRVVARQEHRRLEPHAGESATAPRSWEYRPASLPYGSCVTSPAISRPEPCPNHHVRRRMVRRLPPLEGVARPSRGVDYDYVDLEAVFDGAERAKAISGRTQIPVVVFPDGTRFTEPTDAELAGKARRGHRRVARESGRRRTAGAAHRCSAGTTSDAHSSSPEPVGYAASGKYEMA